MTDYYAYIMSSLGKTLYVGITNDLERRASEHRLGIGGRFTSTYRCSKLVWYERFSNPMDAIEAEKRIRGWTRAKKVALIEAMNPQWLDLAERGPPSS